MQLNWPAPSVLAEIHKGDILKLVVTKTGGKKIVTARWKDHLAGAITSERLPNIIKCMERGKPFVAEVLRARGGECEVLVRPADIGRPQERDE